MAVVETLLVLTCNSDVLFFVDLQLFHKKSAQAESNREFGNQIDILLSLVIFARSNEIEIVFLQITRPEKPILKWYHMPP